MPVSITLANSVLFSQADPPHSIGAAVLSHHVDSFALVSAFFLFSVGCLNILTGLIWREKAKVKRSLLTWREQKKGVLPGVLPRHIGNPKIPSTPPSFVTTSWTGSEKSEYSSDHKGGLGFGRQGEKAAGYQGTIFHSVLRTYELID